MMFLGDASTRQQQAARLKQWILLLMRMAIVALLAMAMARPVLTTTGWGSVTAPGRANVVIVLDCSASMAYVPANQESRFQSAKNAVLKILSRLGPTDRVTLLRAGDPLAARSRAQIDFTPQKIADSLAELAPRTAPPTPRSRSAAHFGFSNSARETGSCIGSATVRRAPGQTSMTTSSASGKRGSRVRRCGSGCTASAKGGRTRRSSRSSRQIHRRSQTCRRISNSLSETAATKR